MIRQCRAKELVDRFAGKRVLVLGDLMLDRYVYGSVGRISPEAPVPVVLVRRETKQLGGAANVALNVRALGGEADMVGAVGIDAAGNDLVGLLTAHGIGTEGVVRHDGMQTTVKTRVLADRQQVVRVDREDPPESVAAVVPELGERIRALIERSDALIVEDYGKGIICQDVVNAALLAAHEAGVPAGLDPKDNHELAYPRLALATPNFREACGAAQVKTREVEDDLRPGGRLPRIAAALQRQWNVELLLITLGSHGMYISPRGGEAVHVPTQAREVFDVSGAGDTVIAVAMLSLAAGATGYEAAALANSAAGVVVGKLGTATCSPDELVGAVGAAGPSGSP